MPRRESDEQRRHARPLVLVADDDDDSRALVADCLRHAGYAVAEARDGIATIERARELLPVAILLDLEMPVVDGCMAARTLKQDPATAGIPILAFTGSEARAYRTRALEAGCEAFLDKPSTGDVIVSALSRLLDSGARGRLPIA
jgi:two-component system cell cycle response regulator DivK